MVIGIVGHEELEKWDHLEGLTISKVLGAEKERRAALQRKANIYIVNRKNVEWLVKTTRWDFDMLVMLNFSRPDDLCVQNTNVSQKVANISMAYRMMAKTWNKDALKAMMADYQAAWSEVAFIDYAIKQLPERDAGIISGFVFKNLSWTEICTKYHISNSSLGRMRARAMLLIEDLYNRRFQSFSIINHFSTTERTSG